MDLDNEVVAPSQQYYPLKTISNSNTNSTPHQLQRKRKKSSQHQNDDEFEIVKKIEPPIKKRKFSSTSSKNANDFFFDYESQHQIINVCILWESEFSYDGSIIK